ncbi:unnamed protein product, partial [Porites evermanni]
PPKISPSKRAFEKYKPRGLFSEFYDRLNAVYVLRSLISCSHPNFLTKRLCFNVPFYWAIERLPFILLHPLFIKIRNFMIR